MVVNEQGSTTRHGKHGGNTELGLVNASEGLTLIVLLGHKPLELVPISAPLVALKNLEISISPEHMTEVCNDVTENQLPKHLKHIYDKITRNTPMTQ